MSLSRTRYIFFKRFLHTLLHDNTRFTMISLPGVRGFGANYLLLLENSMFGRNLYRYNVTRFLGTSIINNNKKYLANIHNINNIVHEYLYFSALYNNILYALQFSCILSYTMSKARVWSLIRMYFLNSNYKIFFFTRSMLRRFFLNIPISKNILQTFLNSCLWALSLQNISTYEEAFNSVERFYKFIQFFNEIIFGGFFLFCVFYTYENYKKILECLNTFRIVYLYLLWYSLSAMVYFFLAVNIVICIFYIILVFTFLIHFLCGLTKIVKI